MTEFIKINTNELKGQALDWVVSRIENVALVDGCIFTKDPDGEQVLYSPSTNKTQGKALIDAYGIQTRKHKPYPEWGASIKKNIGKYNDQDLHLEDGPGNCWANVGITELIAAMRVLVLSKMGKSVLVPENITNEYYEKKSNKGIRP